MLSFFTASTSLYYTLITIAISGSIYILVRNSFISYKKEKESIKQALKGAQEGLSLKKDFSENINNSINIEKKEFNKEEALIKKPENKSITQNPTETVKAKETRESLEALNRQGEILKLIKRAEVLIGQKEYKDAEKILIQALSYDETHKKSLELISQIYLSLEQYPKAIFFLDKFFSHCKETATTCNNYALAHFYQKDFPTTISYYSKAIALEPENAVRYENLGKIFLVLENFEDASKCYIEASKLDHKNLEYHKIIADCLKKETKYEEAKKWYEKILEFSPYEKETLKNLEDLKRIGF